MPLNQSDNACPVYPHRQISFAVMGIACACEELKSLPHGDPVSQQYAQRYRVKIRMYLRRYGAYGLFFLPRIVPNVVTRLSTRHCL